MLATVKGYYKKHFREESRLEEIYGQRRENVSD